MTEEESLNAAIHEPVELSRHDPAWSRMFLAEKTIKNYVSHLLVKLGLERRTQAAVLATRLLGDNRD